MADGDHTGPLNAEPAGAGGAMTRVGALRRYPELVAQLGGDAGTLLARCQVDPAVLANRHAVISYRAFAQVLERTAAELGCPDFGMRLAAAQGGARTLGPLEIAMRNSGTLGEAFRYCVEHVRAYNTGTELGLEEAGGAVRLAFRITALRPPHPAQVVEHALLLTQLNTLDFSGGQVRPQEVWFGHQPVAPPETYRGFFGTVVRFGQSRNCMVFARRDFDLPIPNGDPQLYEMATNFIDLRYPASEPALSTRVRTVIERLLTEGACSYGEVAAMLGMHPRTLQRRLRAEGESFESLKDGVRRELAIRYLRQPAIPLIRVAEMLGYSETSVLSRSCYRWFAASPRQLRAAVEAGAGRDSAL